MRNSALRGIFAAAALVGGLDAGGDGYLDRMVETLRKAWQRSDLIVMTGGLGPTEDDLTRGARHSSRPSRDSTGYEPSTGFDGNNGVWCRIALE